MKWIGLDPEQAICFGSSNEADASIATFAQTAAPSQPGFPQSATKVGQKRPATPVIDRGNHPTIDALRLGDRYDYLPGAMFP